MAIVYLGIDLAKLAFAMHGEGASGKPPLARPSVVRSKLEDLPGRVNTAVGDTLSDPPTVNSVGGRRIPTAVPCLGIALLLAMIAVPNAQAIY